MYYTVGLLTQGKITNPFLTFLFPRLGNCDCFLAEKYLSVYIGYQPDICHVGNIC